MGGHSATELADRVIGSFSGTVLAYLPISQGLLNVGSDKIVTRCKFPYWDRNPRALTLRSRGEQGGNLHFPTRSNLCKTEWVQLSLIWY